MRRITGWMAGPVVVSAWLLCAAPAVAEPWCSADVRARPGTERWHHVTCYDFTRAEVAEQPAHGRVEGIEPRSYGIAFRLAVDADAPREDTVTLRLADRSGTVDVPVGIAVTPLSENTPPTCAPFEQITRTSGTGPAGVDLRQIGCTDPEHDPVVIRGTGPGRHINAPRSHDPADPSFTTEPWWYEATIASGTETTGYYATDSFGARGEVAAIKLTVGPWADHPVECYDYDVHFRPGTPRDFAVGCQDHDLDAFTLRLGSDPSHGDLTWTPVWSGNVWSQGADVRYVPHGDGVEDSFTYVAESGRTAPVERTVRMIPRPWSENTPPSCQVPDGRVWADNPKEIGFGCSDDDGDKVSFSLVRRPEHGTLESFATTSSKYGSGGGRFVYTPSTGFTGDDYAEVEATDGQSEVAIEIPITVRWFSYVAPANLPILPYTPPGGDAATPKELARKALKTSDVKLLRSKGGARVYAARQVWAKGLRARRGSRALAVTCASTCKLDVSTLAADRRVARGRSAVRPGSAATVVLSRKAAKRLRRAKARSVRFVLAARTGKVKRTMTVRLRTR